MEAASSSSDDSSTSSNGPESSFPKKSRMSAGDGKRRRVDDNDNDSSGDGRDGQQQHQGGDAASSSSDDSDEDSSQGSDVDGQAVVKKSDSDSKENSDSESSDDDDDEDNEEDESAPLAERIQRQKDRGVNLKGRRERKAQARKVASDRLANFRKEKKPVQEQNTGEKKRSKNAPTEASSTRADFFRRKPLLNERGIGVEIGAHKYKPRDPRVDSLSGHLDEDHFEHNFEFLQDFRNNEMSALKKHIAARKAPGKKGQQWRRRLGLTNDGGSVEEDKEELKRLQQETADKQRTQVVRAAKRTVKRKMQDEVAEGKRGAYFLPRKEMKRLHLEAKIDEIRKRGGNKAAEKAIEKRRKKNKSKDAGLLRKGTPANY